MRRLVVKERKRTMVPHPSISTHWTKEGPLVVWFGQLTKCLSWGLARSLIQEKSKSLYWWMENSPFYRNLFWDRMIVSLQGNYHANSQGEKKKGRRRNSEQAKGWKIHSNSGKGLDPLKACTLTKGRGFSHWQGVTGIVHSSGFYSSGLRGTCLPGYWLRAWLRAL